MKLQFELGKSEKTQLIIKRNWFTGNFVYFENGVKKQIRNLLDPTTHFNIKLSHNHQFEVGNREKHQVEILHTRPLLFAGFRPHAYEVKINNQVQKNYKGY